MDPDVARMLADLGVAHRETISAPLEGGVSARAAELREADTRAANEARRDRIVKGATDRTNPQHVALSQWNQQATFGGACTTEDLLNRYDGQGHRAALANKLSRNYDETRESQENMYGEERTMWMQGHGGSFPPRNHPPPASRSSRVAPPPTNTKRQRAPSPRSSGVKRFAPGYARHDSASPAPPQPGSIPVINTALASAVQAAAAARAGPSSPLPRPTSANGTNTNGSRPHPAPVATSNSSTPTIAPARPASPALSVSSSSGPAADAQARLKARFLAQKAKIAAAAQPPKTENDRMDVDTQPVAASNAPPTARRSAVNGTATSITIPRQRHPAVHDVHARAQASSLQASEPDWVKALVFAAQRTPEELKNIEEHYRKNPSHRLVLDKARQKLAGEVVKLAADGDEAAAQAYLERKRPCRRWLVEVAIVARSGGVLDQETANHPTVREIVKATKLDNTTSVSVPIAGMLTAAYYGVTGSFLGNKEYRLPVPLNAHVSLTSKGDFDPLTLAEAMDALANYITEKATA